MSLTVVLEGLDDIGNLLGRMLPPRFVDSGDIVWLTIQTFFMATLHLETTGAILLLIFVIVYALELLGGWIRKRII